MPSLCEALARPGGFVVAAELVTRIVLEEVKLAVRLRDGLCEVYDTECIWSEAYERLKAYGEEESMLDGPVVVKDNALQGTSAWANTFLGRDHVLRHSADSSHARANHS